MKRKTVVTLSLRVEVDTEAWEEAYGTTDHVQQDVIDSVHEVFVNAKWVEFATAVHTSNVASMITLADRVTPVVALWQCEADGKCPPHPEGPDGKLRTHLVV